MGKLVSIETFERFETLWNANKIDQRSLTFILDTGQLYTHGIFISGATYGTEVTNQSIELTVAGTKKALSLSSHTHSNYLEKNKNIDISTYKLVSGEKNLIYLSGAKVYVGDTTLPIQIQSNAALKSYRNSTEYTILDTGNFSVEAKTTTGTVLSNVATIKYAGTNFQLDYVKRINTSSTFDSLAAYTNAGTTLVNNKQYGIATFYTDGTVSSNARWAQLRIDIADKKLEIRTSSSTNWVEVIQAIPTNSATTAGTVPQGVANSVYMTDSEANPSWTSIATSVSSTSTNLVTSKAVYDYINGDSSTSTLSSVSLSTDWSNVDNLSNKLSNKDGSYLIQITYGSKMYTGYFSYISTGVNTDDEIILHCAGTNDSVGGVQRGRLYAKICTGNEDKIYLKLAATQAESNAIITIKYRKLI